MGQGEIIMSNTVEAQFVFLTLVRSTRGIPRVRLLTDSIRSFGGDWRDGPIWLFETLSSSDHSPATQSSWASLESAGVKVIPLNVPDAVRRYDFGDKVYACAQAEARATGIQSLIWADLGVLFIQPPRLYDLGASFDAAVRPVHIKNVGLLATEPLDGFWQKVYQTVGVQDISATVDSFVDTQHLRAYFNSHAFAVNPSTGLLRQWLECFEVLVGDQAFQSAYCQGERHQVFLHQAVLSTLIATRLDPQQHPRLQLCLEPLPIWGLIHFGMGGMLSLPRAWALILVSATWLAASYASHGRNRTYGAFGQSSICMDEVLSAKADNQPLAH